MTSTRQLAAIMFTDIVGYTAMMQSDEQKAVAVIKHYNSTLEKHVRHHHGRVLNYYGDGSLCLFNSATAAVQCSVDIQQELQQEPVVPLRIGLHIGEVSFENEKAIGDGVNIASRIQSLGQENTILISADIHDKIKNNSSFSTTLLGNFDFKNIRKPMEVYALSNDGLYVPDRKSISGKLDSPYKKRKTIQVLLYILLLAVSISFVVFNSLKSSGDDSLERSIAVLPFTDMSQAGDQEYFSDGLTEDIITQLAKINAFKVTSRTSIMKYKSAKKSLKEIGRELGAAIILEGSVQRAGEKVRITAQLINAATDEHLWAETYDRTMEDIFAIQTDIATKIANALKAKLTTEEEQGIAKKYTDNTVAYQLYLQGRFFWNKRLEEPVRKSIEFFKLAIEQDSTYALAYAGLGDAYLMLGVYGSSAPVESFPLAKKYAEKAMALDSSLAEAYGTLIDINIHYDWNPEAAEQFYQKAVHYNPRYANAYHWHSEVYVMQKNFDNAIMESKKALEIDPNLLIIHVQLASNYIHAGRYQEAIGQVKKVIELDSSFAFGQYTMGLAYVGLKQYDKALDYFQKAADLAPGRIHLLSALAYAEAMNGHQVKAIQIKDEILMQAKIKYVSFYEQAIAVTGLGDDHLAIQYLEQAYEAREPWMPFIGMNPLFSPLYPNPQFQGLLRKIGIDKW